MKFSHNIHCDLYIMILRRLRQLRRLNSDKEAGNPEHKPPFIRAIAKQRSQPIDRYI
jgi:hypothetical protein